MPRDFETYLEDICEAIQKIQAYTAEMTQEEFEQDPKTVDAVLRNLEVMGEAAKGVPETTRSEHPEVEWRKITGLRDLIIHRYFGIDLEVVWDTLQNKLPALLDKVCHILKP